MVGLREGCFFSHEVVKVGAGLEESVWGGLFIFSSAGRKKGSRAGMRGVGKGTPVPIPLWIVSGACARL